MKDLKYICAFEEWRAVVHEKEFYSKDRSRSWKMTEAGGFVWRKI
jgi:hypothetical protein